MQIARLLVALLCLAALGGCSTYTDKNLAARKDLRRGDFAGAEAKLNELLGVESSRELPRTWGSETALTLLERATVLQAMGEYGTSARDFTAAEKELEWLDIANDTAGDIGKYLFSDDATKYKAPPTEKLLVNAFNMINYLALDDLAGARVEARRFQVMHKYLHDHFPAEPHGAFGSYLAGFVFEKSGEWDTALRHYDEVLAQAHAPSLHPVIRRLAQGAPYRTERLEAIVGAPGGQQVGGAEGVPQEQQGEILIVLKTGAVPVKEARRIPVGAALGLAANYVSGDTKILEYGMFKVVSYPELVPAENLFSGGSLLVSGRHVPLDPLTDVAEEIRKEYEAYKPKVVGAALTRMITRAVAGEGARALGKQHSGGLGFLASALVEGTMVALDRPDTRSWSTLPAQVHLARIPVEPGEHAVEIALRGRFGVSKHQRTVTVLPGGFAVVDLSTLR
jgi:tetratricopeptide (TPR) repeat protein